MMRCPDQNDAAATEDEKEMSVSVECTVSGVVSHRLNHEQFTQARVRRTAMFQLWEHSYISHTPLGYRSARASTEHNAVNKS